MKLIALLCFFDEDPDWLAATVSSLAKAQVDHLIGVDGCFLLYPNSLRCHRSPQQQTQAILGTAYGLGIGLTLHTPNHPWLNGEVEKRNTMFDLGRTVTQDPADWYLIIDSDEVITHAAFDLKHQLEQATEDVAYYQLNDNTTPNHVRGLYRNHPDLNIRITHWGYSHNTTPLWDGHSTPAADLTGYLILEHRQRDIDEPRHQAKLEYYQLRDSTGIERIPNESEVLR